MKSSEFKTYIQQVAEKCADKIKNNEAPANQKTFMKPFNPSTGRFYHGSNAALLAMQDFDDPRFLTYDQAVKHGWYPRKGYRKNSIEFSRANQENGKIETVYATVINAQDISGMPPLEMPEKLDINPLNVVQDMLTSSNATIINEHSDEFVYDYDDGKMYVPFSDAFLAKEGNTADDYCRDALYVLTMYEAQQQAKNNNYIQGSIDGIRESLTEALAYMMACKTLDVYDGEKSVAPNSAFLLHKLNENPLEIKKAVVNAQRLHDRLMGPFIEKQLAPLIPPVPEIINAVAKKVEPLSVSIKSPYEELRAALIKAGANVTDDFMPVMDGETYRLPKKDDNQLSISYSATANEKPSGIIIDEVSKAVFSWDYFEKIGLQDYKNEIDQLVKQSVKVMDQRNDEVKSFQKEADIKVLDTILNSTVLESRITPFLQKAGLGAMPGVTTDHTEQITYIPLRNIDGKIEAVQVISADGEKRFIPDKQPDGSYHFITEPAEGAFHNSKAIIIANSYESAATLYKAMKEMDIQDVSVVAACGNKNMKNVAASIHEKFPATKIVIAADNHLGAANQTGINFGINYGEQAAKAVNAELIYPVFEKEFFKMPPSQRRQISSFHALASKFDNGMDKIKERLMPLKELGLS